MTRLLIADDNPMSLRFLSDSLAESGYRCTEAADGTIALAQALDRAFDLLVLDARMPGLGGADVLRELRARPGPSQHAAALATTAADDAATHADLLRAGFAHVLAKPLAVAVLRATVARHLPDGPVGPGTAWLDDRRAFDVAGGDAKIVHALRKLLCEELDRLPAEIAQFESTRDVDALHDRLHRLDASAGFCGVPLLVDAGADLRARVLASAWPRAAIDDFLNACLRARLLLRQ